MQHKNQWTLAVLCLSAAAACSSKELPAKQLADSESAIRAAEELKAADNPRAALHLRLAREQVTSAQAYMKQGDYRRAKNTLARADADAELSLALAQSDGAAKEAQEATDRVQQLQRSIPAPYERGRQ